MKPLTDAERAALRVAARHRLDFIDEGWLDADDPKVDAEYGALTSALRKLANGSMEP